MVFSLYVLMFFPKWFARYVSWSLVIVVPWIVYNLVVYDLPLPPYYLPASHDSRAMGEALLGNLFSPARGLLIYSPVVLLALPGFMRSLRERSERWLHVAFAASIVLHWLAVARFGQPWWGGASYGPRFMTDVLPFLVYFVAFACQAATVAERRRAGIAGGVALLAGVSVVMHAQGALNVEPYRWYGDPVNIDCDPTRLWSWRDPPFARGLIVGMHLIVERPGPLLDLTGGVVPADVRLYRTELSVRFQADFRLDRAVLQSGWSEREEWGVWSDSSEARLVLDAKPGERLTGSGDRFLIVRARGFVVPQHPQVMVDVVVNGTSVAVWTFALCDGVLERRARVPSALVKFPLVITFQIRNAASPAELGMGADPRHLGIGLTSLRLARAEGGG